MKLQKFVAPTKREAMDAVRRYFGPDAVIVGDRRTGRGVEVTAGPAQSSAAAYEAALQAQRDKAAGSGAGRAAPVAGAGPVSVSDEIQSLRHLIEDQFGALLWREGVRNQPYRSQLLRRLMAFGLSLDLCNELADGVADEVDANAAWTRATANLLGKVAFDSGEILTRGGVVALLGPAGVGKTTTAAKLAGQFLMKHGPGTAALITTDDFRLGAQEQLLAFGRILDVPVLHATNQQELEECVRSVRDCGLVVIDTEGLKQPGARPGLFEPGVPRPEPFRYSRLARVFALLQSGISASALHRSMQALAHEKVHGCILTKLDECESLGSVLSCAVRHDLPIGFVADGQQVPMDLRPADRKDLAELADSFQDPDQDLQIDEQILAAGFSQPRIDRHA